MTWQNIINRLHQYKKTAGKCSIAGLGLFGLFARGEERHKAFSTISFTGKDEFTQVTIDSTTGNKYIETCIQLK